MRISGLVPSVVLTLMLNSACTTQPQTTAPKGAAGTAQVHGTLGQVMRGILFPNSNVIFAVQSQNPAEIKPAGDPATSTDPLSGTYGGWTAVENSGVALAEAANLLVIPGRQCGNGGPVPIQNADWPGLVQGLRNAGMAVVKAAQSKNQDNIVDAAGT